MTGLHVPDSPKMLRETLCAAQTALNLTLSATGHHPRTREHVARLQRLIDECDRHRPLGPDGKHDDRHTGTCGCEDTPRPASEPIAYVWTDPVTGIRHHYAPQAVALAEEMLEEVLAPCRRLRTDYRSSQVARRRRNRRRRS